MSANPKYTVAPQAMDLDPANIKPMRELQDSNHVLDDTAKMNALYNEQGYLLFRGVLDQASVKRALKRMMLGAVRLGIIEPDTEEPVWTGRSTAAKIEENEGFIGICKELIHDPKNQPVFEHILGEPFSQVPIVQYRAYPPNFPLSMPHQEGFQSPGIVGYRPIWMPLVDIDESMGGLTLALGVHKRGFVHNMERPPLFPIAADTIPADAWATTTYHPGDVLVIHHCTPHIGLHNRSNKVRFSIDTRVQSAKNPCVVLGNVAAADNKSVTLKLQDGPTKRYRLADVGFLRTTENAGVKLSHDEFAKVTPVGLRVIAAVNGDEAVMVRRAAEG